LNRVSLVCYFPMLFFIRTSYIILSLPTLAHTHTNTYTRHSVKRNSLDLLITSLSRTAVCECVCCATNLNPVQRSQQYRQSNRGLFGKEQVNEIRCSYYTKCNRERQGQERGRGWEMCVFELHSYQRLSRQWEALMQQRKPCSLQYVCTLFAHFWYHDTEKCHELYRDNRKVLFYVCIRAFEAQVSSSRQEGNSSALTQHTLYTLRVFAQRVRL